MEGQGPVLPVELGTVVAGKYRLDRVLGSGGMGAVVLATHLALEEQVAIKFLPPGAAVDPTVSARFLREARAGARIKGEHVVRVLDVATLDDGTPYIVMEYLAGIDLDALTQQVRRGPLPLGEAIDYVLQACEGVAEAHAAGIVHRDLKPSNLFVTNRPDGSPLVKIFDFGISKVKPKGAGPDPSLTQTSQPPFGSPLYMSPEQMRGDRDLDHRSDIWSLGVILYELATATTPFSGDSLPQLCALVMSATPLPPSVRNTALPPMFDQVVLRCLAKNPEDRYPSVADLATALVPMAPEGSRVSPVRIAAVLGGAGGRAAQRLSAPGFAEPRRAPAPLATTTGGVTGGGGPGGAPDWLRIGYVAAAGPALVGIALIVLSLSRRHAHDASASDTPRAEALSASAEVASPGEAASTLPFREPPPPPTGTPEAAEPGAATTPPTPAPPAPAPATGAAPAGAIANGATDAGVPRAAARKPPAPRSAFGGRD